MTTHKDPPLAEPDIDELTVQLPGSFEDFYKREFPRLVDLAYALSGSRLAAEDLAQDALIAAQRDWSRVGRLERPGAWARRVVINKAASQYQRRMAEIRALSRLAPLRKDVLPKLQSEYDEIWKAVRQLPNRQAQAVALFYVDQMSIAEVSQVLECADGTVKALLHQARTRLADRLRIVRWIRILMRS